MSESWFRRYAGFSYRPTTWQGRSVVGLMALVAIPSGIAWLSLANTRPALASVAGSIAVLAALAGHAVVLWKMDWDYRRPLVAAFHPFLPSDFDPKRALANDR